jgi:nucleoside-diphosphate-sugar epimerase
MKVLITGGAGYVGAVVTAHLLASGMDVVVLDKLVYGAESLLALFGHPCFRLLPGDVRNQATLRDAMRDVSAVVHLAAIVGEPACAIDPEAAWTINYGGTKAVLAVAEERGVQRVIVASTCSNYGASSTGVLVDESFPLGPLSDYAKSKVEAEQWVLESRAELCRVVLRLGTICGLSSRMRFDLLVNEMARAAALREPIHIFSPLAWRPYLHVGDAARAVAHCLSAPRDQLHGKVMNVVGENCRKQDLMHIVRKHYPEVKLEITDRAPDLRDYRVSGERIQRETGFATKYSVEDAFLEISTAVSAGVFRDPAWAGYSALPIEPGSVLLKEH